MLNLAARGCDVSRARRREWHAVMVLLVIGTVACGDASGPPEPGQIMAKTVTSGFMKPESYSLLVNGVAQRTVAANDQVTISAVDPGSYQVSLGDVPENCSAESATVTVVSKATAEIEFTVECAFDPPVSYTLNFTSERLDLATGNVTVCVYGICPANAVWDMYVHNSFSTEPRSVIRQNQAVQIAHVAGVTLATLSEADLAGANFTTSLVDTPFDSNRVILIRKADGRVFALGNPSENPSTQKSTFAASLVAAP